MVEPKMTANLLADMALRVLRITFRNAAYESVRDVP